MMFESNQKRALLVLFCRNTHLHAETLSACCVTTRSTACFRFVIPNLFSSGIDGTDVVYAGTIRMSGVSGYFRWPKINLEPEFFLCRDKM